MLSSFVRCAPAALSTVNPEEPRAVAASISGNRPPRSAVPYWRHVEPPRPADRLRPARSPRARASRSDPTIASIDTGIMCVVDGNSRRAASRSVPSEQDLSRPLDDDALLTDVEVSEMLGNVPRSTLRAWRTRGLGPRFIRLALRTPRYRLSRCRRSRRRRGGDGAQAGDRRGGRRRDRGPAIEVVLAADRGRDRRAGRPGPGAAAVVAIGVASGPKTRDRETAAGAASGPVGGPAVMSLQREHDPARTRAAQLHVWLRCDLRGGAGNGARGGAA